MLLMCTYFQQTTDMTMTTMTEGLQQKQNNIQLYTKTVGRSSGGGGHSIIGIIPIWWQNSFILPCIFVPGPDVPPSSNMPLKTLLDNMTREFTITNKEYNEYKFAT